jgi:hypothetical protein
MYTIPKKFNFEIEWSEPRESPKCIFSKKAIHNDIVLVVKRIKEKYCATLQFGDSDYFDGVSIFGVDNEKDAIDAVVEASVRAKFAKR